MQTQTQFSVFLINKPGVLAQTLTALAAEKINLMAMTMMDSMEHGVLRLVTDKPEKTRALLNRINASVSEAEVLCLTLSNQAGALADIASKLAGAHININYAYCTAGARGGKTTGILKVADPKKAIKILDALAKKRKTAAQKKQGKLRRSPNRTAR